MASALALTVFIATPVAGSRAQPIKLEAPKEWPGGGGGPRPPRVNDRVRIGLYENTLQKKEIREFQRFACIKPEDGKFTPQLRERLVSHLHKMNMKDQAFPDRLTARDGVSIRQLILNNQRSC